MSLTQIAAPYPIFTDTDGTPLDDGYIYIGEINKNPETNPIAVYWDPEFKFPAPQPIRTNNGYPWRMGTPAMLYADSQFSITIRNKRHDLVLYAPVGFGVNPAAVAGSVVKDDFVGNGSTTQYAISASPATELATNVFINGAYQEKDTYSINANVLTFSEAPPLNASIEVVTLQSSVLGATSANLVSYQQGGAGSVQTDVQTKLRETVSVKDFGAVGDGVTDDTAAIQAAIDADVSLEVPEGNYLVGALTISNPLAIKGVGDDRSVFTIKTDIGQNNMFTASGIDGIEITGCKFDFRNDVVTPNFSDLTKQNVFHLTSCSNVTISGNHFVRGLNQFVRFDGTALAENVNVYITENLFENGGKGAVEVRRYGRNVHVCSNNFTDVCDETISGITYDKSISVSGTVGIWIKDNYVLQNISGGGTIIVEYIDRQSEAVNILNNRVHGSTDNGIKVGASVDVRVEGNSCLYSTANGIYIEGCYDAIVQNNWCYESGTNAIRIFEDGDTGRLNRNVTVRGNTFQNSNMSGATLGVVGASVGSTESYHLACRQSSYVYVYENMFVDDTTGQAGGIYMAATDYYIERNDMLRLKAGSVTFTNTSSIISDRFRIVNNKGAQTTAQGLATIPNGASSITVTPDVVNESSNKVMQAVPYNVLSGTVAYWCCTDEANNTFAIRTRNSSHAAATVTSDTNFNWSFSVDNAIGIFGKTTR